MKIVGHRGAAGLAPENTLASLSKGLEHGADELEFDLRVTKDNVVILHHDAVLRDPAGNRFRIREHTYHELLVRKTDLTVFDKVLQVFDGKIRLLAEIKPGEPIEPIIKVLHEHSRLDGLTVSSHGFAILLALRKEFPVLQLAVNEPWSGVRGTYRARKIGTRRIHMNRLWLWTGFIRSLKHGGHQLYAYTVNNPKKASSWSRHGLAGVITDYPDRYR